MMLEDDRNKDVIFPYLTGDNITSDPKHSPSRWVINFFDWPLEVCATKYPQCFAIVEELVRPERTRVDKKGEYVLRKPLPEKWWIFADKRPKLYKTIHSMQRTLAINRHSKYPTFVFCPTTYVFSEATVVVAIDCHHGYAVLNSSLHEAWAWWRCSTMGSTTLRYTPSKGFDSFSFPHVYERNENLGRVGSQHDHHRQRMLRLIYLGLTETYNLFHEPNLSSKVVAKTSKQDSDVAAEAYSGLLRLRQLHREMDEAVLAAYGWHEPSGDGPPIELRHDFYEVDYLPENDRVRYTIHPDARREILTRLLLLNHKRHAEEVAAAKHGKSKTTKNKAAKKKPAKAKQSGPSLFDGESSE